MSEDKETQQGKESPSEDTISPTSAAGALPAPIDQTTPTKATQGRRTKKGHKPPVSLTPDQLIQLANLSRQEPPIPQRVLAEMFNVTAPTIGNALKAMGMITDKVKASREARADTLAEITARILNTCFKDTSLKDLSPLQASKVLTVLLDQENKERGKGADFKGFQGFIKEVHIHMGKGLLEVPNPFDSSRTIEVQPEPVPIEPNLEHGSDND